MLARGESFCLSNQLKLMKKIACVPVCLSLVLLNGCDLYESGGSAGGSHAYEGRMEVQNVKSAKENSSAEVKVRILTHKGKDVAAGDLAFDNAVEVRLKWNCWQWQDGEGEGEKEEEGEGLPKNEIDRGSAKLTIAAGAGSGTVTIDDLPEALEVNASIFAGPQYC